MKVEGYQISEEVQQTTLEALPEVFTFNKMQAELIEQGVPVAPSYRGADRLIQRLRRAGKIRYEGKCWHKI